MKNMLYTLILVIVVGACSTVNDGDKDPPVVQPPIEHEGIIYGKSLTIHGQSEVKDVGTLSYDYGRLAKSLMDKATANHMDLPDTQTAIDIEIKNRSLDQDSAGLYIAFETDASSISFNFKLRDTWATGILPRENNGFDLYLLENSEWTYKKTFHLDLINAIAPYVVTGTYENTSEKMGKYILLFPTYNGLANTKNGTVADNTEDFTIEINLDAKFYDRSFFDEDTKKPILIYGTSITQGAAPDRVGLTHTALTLFEMEREIINIGLRGRALMCKVMGEYLADIPSSVFFIDTTMNMHDVPEADRIPQVKFFIKAYRAKNPKTPIVVVSLFEGRADEPGPNFIESGKGLEGTQGTVMKEAVEQTIADGFDNIYFIPRDDFIPTTTDAIHPDTEGMKNWAEKYHTVLRSITLDD